MAKSKKMTEFDAEILKQLATYGMTHAMQTQKYRACKRLALKGYCWQLGNSREFHATARARCLADFPALLPGKDGEA